MYASREAHVKAESSIKLKKALKHNIRHTGDRKEIGDMMWFKSREDGIWRGPGKVVGLDGKNILVKFSSHVWSVRSDDATVVGNENRGLIVVEEDRNKNEEVDSEDELAEYFGGLQEPDQDNLQPPEPPEQEENQPPEQPEQGENQPEEGEEDQQEGQENQPEGEAAEEAVPGMERAGSITRNASTAR